MVKRLIFVVFIFLTGFLAIFIWWRWAINPVSPPADSRQVFVVPQGQSGATIGKRLYDQGYIKSQLAFKLLVDRKNLTTKLQAGDFYLSQSMDLNDILQSLTQGSLDYWLTIPEGWRVEEIAAAISKKSSLAESKVILAAKPFEGRLFPDTYLIPQQASAEDIVTILTDNFEKKFTPLKSQLEKTGLSETQAITLASLIEREAKHELDRSLVSSVIHNRLKLGMALQIDATVQYLLGVTGDWWPQNLTRENLQTRSPYNTYLNSGLPPAPIANPGLASLKAAVNPSQTDYLYYLSDAQGYNHYSEDLEGHNANIDQYLSQ